MKLTYKQIAPFVQNPDPQARVIVIYGPDQGLVKERAKSIGLKTVDDLNDPFNAVTLTAEKILDDPSLFFDEAMAQSLMGGARLIMVKDGADSFAPMLKDYLETPSSDNLVIVTADNLGPRSALRKLAESASNAAALPCYVEDERDLSQLIRTMVQEAGFTIHPEALTLFAAALVGDRAIARSEIDKLLLYKGAASAYDRPVITMEDIEASCGNVRDWSMDRLVYAVADGRPVEMVPILEALLKDQIAVVMILRALQNHFWKLLQVQSAMQGGASQDQAIKSLNPPLFFKLEAPFRAQLNRWSLNRLQRGLAYLNEIEAKCKETGYSDTGLLQHCLFNLSRS